jgi:hypothetical protein
MEIAEHRPFASRTTRLRVLFDALERREAVRGHGPTIGNPVIMEDDTRHMAYNVFNEA